MYYRLKKALKQALAVASGDDEKMVRLRTPQARRGRALLAYAHEPYLRQGEAISLDHTQYWESWTLGQILLARGYDLDVISYRNTTFQPRQRYDLLLSSRVSCDRLSRRVGEACLKIVHLDTAHWADNNSASYARFLAVKQARSRVLKFNTMRQVEANYALENADCATVLGNQFTLDTYAYAGKPLYRLPISTPPVDAEPESRDFNRVGRNFLWFGSRGFVHKGLDLVLDAFRDLPDCKLYVCGPLEQEPSFVEAFHRELYATPNIVTVGWVDVQSSRFQEIVNDVAALIYPSCAEGGGASALLCMRMGIVPLLSRQASVDLDASYGMLVQQLSVAAVRDTVQAFATLPAGRQREMACAARRFVLQHHGREHFQAAAERLFDTLLAERRNTGA